MLLNSALGVTSVASRVSRSMTSHCDRTPAADRPENAKICDPTADRKIDTVHVLGGVCMMRYSPLQHLAVSYCHIHTWAPLPPPLRRAGFPYVLLQIIAPTPRGTGLLFASIAWVLAH